MTDEQMNAAIAEACGWKREGDPYQSFDDDSMVQCWTNPLTSEVEYKTPDYCNDLNAMHEAENTLMGIYQKEYFHTLVGVCDGHGGTWYSPYCATARQRAESFLRTVGKWVAQ